MDLLIIVTNPEAGPILTPLAHACHRAHISWEVFCTNDGVRVLTDSAVSEAIRSANRAVACQESWQRFLPDSDCPVETGSQTDNSAMVAEAAHIVSL